MTMHERANMDTDNASEAEQDVSLAEYEATCRELKRAQQEVEELTALRNAQARRLRYSGVTMTALARIAGIYREHLSRVLNRDTPAG